MLVSFLLVTLFLLSPYASAFQFVPVKKIKIIKIGSDSIYKSTISKILTFCECSPAILDFIWDYHSFMNVRSCNGGLLLLLNLNLVGIF